MTNEPPVMITRCNLEYMGNCISHLDEIPIIWLRACMHDYSEVSIAAFHVSYRILTKCRILDGWCIITVHVCFFWVFGYRAMETRTAKTFALVNTRSTKKWS